MSDVAAAQATEAGTAATTMLSDAQAATDATAQAGADAGTGGNAQNSAGGQQIEGKDKPEGGDKPKDGEAEAENKPIEYAEFKLPEGISVDAPILDEAKKLFQADGLSQEQAQKYVDLYTNKMKEAAEAPYQLWAETQRDWQQAVKTDKEIGGANLAGNLAVAAKAVDRFGGDALRQALNMSGAGNNPEVIRAFVRIGKAISEDGLVLGSAVTHDTKSRADRLYPNDPLKRD